MSASCSPLPPQPSAFSLAALNPASWFAAFARSSILAFLDHAITVGHLTVSDADGTHHYGTRGSGQAVHLHVTAPAFWSRVLLAGDLGFSEAYMAGDVDIDSLPAVMNLWLDNQSAMASLPSTVARASAALSALSNSLLGQTRAQAARNAAASYDQPNTLFAAFLSSEMMYSCALWGPPEGGPRGDHAGRIPGALEAAQRRKIHRVLRAARARPGARILEFGTGWGALAIEAARTYGCEVDTLTLSEGQRAVAEERVREAGLEGRVRVHLMDYRAVPPEWEGAFDALVSVEMLEHVGAAHYATYFRLVDFALKPTCAAAVVSATTLPEARYTGFQADDFMRRHMWPHSVLPSVSALVGAAHTGARARLALEGVECHTAHYPRTLRAWGARLARAGLKLPRAEERKWQYLFAYAAAGFERGHISCHMLTFARPGDPPVECD